MNEHDLITLAARSVTAVEPPGDLEARIKARLDATVMPAPPRRIDWRWAAVAAGTTAVVVMATVLVPGPWPAEQNPGDRPAQGAVVPSPSPMVQGPGVVEMPSTVPGPKVAPETVTRRPRTVDPGTADASTAANDAWMARRIPALDPVQRLTVSSLTLDSIQPEPLAITPLTVTPMMVSPIADGGSGHPLKF